MEVPTKIRLLNCFRRIFPEWTMRRQALVIEHAFDSDLAKEKNYAARVDLTHQRDHEASEYWGALAEFRSRQLVNEAQKVYIPLDGMEWETDQYANRYLDSQSQSKLSKLVVEETRKTWEFRLKVIGGVIGALTGLVGTIIGLVAVWKKK